ncbi:hypothetical protein NAU58_07280 [Pseudomonas stutzeri]|uniref:Uncharacterized protein n=1 Tax=Stutzerimonas stutzeri TaxID=316 RepID=A0A2N8S068_STUST|nr:hypothetical protein [Stutzerimonas stutzeri]MCQ4295373.1 hypothetical protein [Stutzerimonas stutzeri]PNF80027.1 hypothetical protein CXK92_15540 [Stutzerimonas stutzeri]
MPELWQAHLTFALFAYVVLPGFGRGRIAQLFRLFLLLAVSFVTVDGLSLAAYMRSFTDDVAITTLVILAFAAAVRMGLLDSPGHSARVQVLIVLAALALFLYPATMGLSYLDPYQLGYDPRPLLAVVGLLALGLLLLRNWLGACMLGLATLAFSLGLKPSPNYWDYLLDPFIALFSCGALIGYAYRMLVRKPTVAQ